MEFYQVLLLVIGSVASKGECILIFKLEESINLYQTIFRLLFKINLKQWYLICFL